MDYFNVNDGIKIAYQYIDGHEPTIVFIHGAHISSSEWQPQLEAVAEQSHLLIDLRGHGQSERKGYPYSITQFADDVAQLIDHLQLEQVIVCGHSLGGIVAQQLVVDRPELLSGLILADTSFGVRGTRLEAALANATLPLLNLMPVNMQVNWFASSLGKQSDDTKQYALKEISKHAENEQSYRAVWRAVTEFDGSDKLTKIACKTLIVVGKLNKQTHKQAKIMHNQIADSQLIYIEDAGHMLNWDNPAQFNRALLDFIAEFEKRTV